jgi:biotin operon repressor
MEINIVIVLLALICIYLLSTVIGLNSRVKGLEYRLEQMSKQMDIPEMPINNEVRHLIKEGNDVKAVKKVRETLGYSLIEAKQYVDALKLEGK